MGAMMRSHWKHIEKNDEMFQVARRGTNVRPKSWLEQRVRSIAFRSAN